MSEREGERENSRDAYHPSGGEEYVQTVGRKHEGKKAAGDTYT